MRDVQERGNLSEKLSRTLGPHPCLENVMEFLDLAQDLFQPSFVTGIRHIDTLGALIIAALAWREGRETFEKSRGGSCGCGGTCVG